MDGTTRPRKTPAPRTATGAPRRKAANGARRPLTRQAIVAAGLALVARDGLAGLTTRRLGDALGVEAMSIYHHFASKRHLLDALVDHAIASVELPSSGAPLERLRAVCSAYRAMAHRYPKLYPLIALHRLNTPVGVRFIEHVLALVHAVTGDAEAGARQFRALGYFITGAALDETSGYAQGPSAADPVGDDYVARHCPRLHRAAAYFGKAQWNTTFELGLDALLDGLARAPRRASRTTRGANRARTVSARA